MAAAAGVAENVMADGPVRLASDAGGVDVTFKSGSESRYEVVVGADGQHSTVRRLAFGPESEYSRPLGLGIATFRSTKLWSRRLTSWRSATCRVPA